MRAIPASIAVRASDVNITQELHLDFFETCAAATLALTLRGIEAERAGVEPPLAGKFGLGEEFAHIFESPDVDHRVGSWGFSKRRLVDEHHAPQVFPALDGGEGRARF